jgi:hypothetical protein
MRAERNFQPKLVNVRGRTEAVNTHVDTACAILKQHINDAESAQMGLRKPIPEVRSADVANLKIMKCPDATRVDLPLDSPGGSDAQPPTRLRNPRRLGAER